MQIKNIAIIKTDSDPDPLKSHDWVEKIFSDYLTEDDFTLSFFNAREALPSPQEFDVYLITGSRHSVYLQEDWIIRLRDYVRDKDFPKLIGICFGHQMIAHARGGKVENLGWNLGRQSLTPVAEPSWLNRPMPNGLFRFNHQDHVVSLPCGYQTVAKSNACRHAVIQAENVLGLQFHPEFTEEYHKRVLQRVFKTGLISETDYNKFLTDISHNCNGQAILPLVKDFINGD